MIQTRSGRVVKQPERYTPVERVEDDYATDEYDSDESEVTSEIEYSDEEIDESESDLDSFIAEEDEENSGEEEVDGDDDDSDAEVPNSTTPEP